MSAVATDVFDRAPYPASKVDLREKFEATPDRLFSPEGRVGVWRYNARLFQAFLLFSVAGLLMFFGVSGGNDSIVLSAAIPAFIVFVIGFAMVVYTAIKRLHDLNRSGWFFLVGLIPIVGAIWTLYYALKPGKEEDNRYGAVREATKGDKIMGVLGIMLTVLITIGVFIPQG